MLINTVAGTNTVQIAASTGNITTSGDIAVNGGDLTTTSGTATLFNTLATNLAIGSAATSLSMGSAAGTVTVNGDLKVSGNDIQSSDATTLTFLSDGAAVRNVKTAGDLIVGGNDIRASDSALAMTLTDATGDVTMPGDLAVNGGDLTTTATTFNVTGATNYNIGTTTSTGTVAVGRSTNSNTVSIADAACTGTQTVNIGSGVTGAGISSITIGSLQNSSKIDLFAGSSSGTGIRLVTGGRPITMSASGAGTIDIGTSSTTGDISIGGASTSTGLISVGKSTVDNTVAIANAACTGTQTVNMATGATGATGMADVTIGSTNFRSTVKVYAGSGAGTGLKLETNGGAVNISASTAGLITIGTSATTGTTTIGGTSTTGTITIGQSTAENTVNIAAAASVASVTTQTINIGTGNGRNVITIGSSGSNGTGQQSSLTMIARSEMLFTGSTGTVYTMGGETATGDITIGRSTATNTINVGNGATTSGNTQTIYLGNSAGSSGRTTISIASSSLGLKKVYIGRNGGVGYGFGSPIGSEVYVGGNIVKIGDNEGGTGSYILLSGSIECLGVTATSSDLIAGAAELGSFPAWTADPTVFAIFGHKDLNHAALGNYALLQSNVGSTAINAASGQGVYIRNSNNDLGYFADGFVSITGRVNTNVVAWYGNNFGTSGTAIFGGTQGVYLTGSAGCPYYIGGETSTASIDIGRSNATQSINFGIQAANTSGQTQTINLGHYTASGGSKNVNVRGDVIKIGDSGGAVQISNDTTSGTVSIGTAANTQTLNFGTGAAAKTVTMGSTNSTSALTLDAGTGNINIGTSAAARTINIGPTGAAGVLFTINIGTSTGGGTSGSPRTINIGDYGSGFSAVNLEADYVNVANNASSQLGFFAVTPVVRQTGGAATADLTYSSNERDMINAMYTALRNYGLLT
jgi:hypothetical protein